MRFSYKKILSLILVAFMLCSSNIPAIAGDNLIDCDFKNNAPEDWQMVSTGSATISVNDEFAVMNCDTTESGTNAGTYLSSPAVSFDKKPYVINIKSNISAESSLSSGALRTAVLTTSDKVLFTIVSDGSKMFVRPFGSAESSAELSVGVEFDTVIYVDPDEGTSVIWLDDNKIFEGDAPDWISSFDYSNTSIIFVNSLSGSDLISVWNIDKVSLGFPGELQITSNPVDGAVMVDTAVFDFAEINFGSVVSPAITKNVALKSGDNEESLSEEDCVVKYCGEKIYVAPVAGFSAIKTYKVEVSEILDPSGAVQGTYSIMFTTAPEGYEAPVVTITQPEENVSVFEGQSVTVSVNIESTSEIEKVEFVVEGVVAYTAYSAPYIYTIDDIEAGSYDVFVRAYDVYEGSGISETVTITAQNNTLPTVSISGISDGETVSSGSTLEITANAEDAEGEISKVILYINDRVFAEKTEAPFTFSVTDLPIGVCEIKVRAYDEADTFSESAVNVSVLKSITKIMADEKFDDYEGGQPADPNISIVKEGGYHQSTEIDSQHGISMAIGSNTKTTGNGTAVRVSHVSNNLITTEFDVYFPSKNAKLVLMARNVGAGNYLTFFTFGTDGKITMNGSGGTVLSGEYYETGKWYRIKHILDGVTNKFDCYIGEVTYVNGERVIDYVQYADDRLAAGYNKVTKISSVGAFVVTSDNVPGYVVIDNIYSEAVEQMPYITGVSSIFDGETYEEVLYDADKILVKLSRSISATDVKKITSLRDEISEIPITSAVYDEESGGIVITPAKKLNSGMKHTVTFGSALEVNTGETLGYELSGEFTTTAKSFDVADGSFIRNGNNVKFKINVDNSSGGSKNVIVIITAWNGNELISSGAFETTLTNGQNPDIETVPIDVSGATRIEGYAVESLIPGKPISNMIWTE